MNESDNKNLNYEGIPKHSSALNSNSSSDNEDNDNRYEDSKIETIDNTGTEVFEMQRDPDSTF